MDIDDSDTIDNGFGGVSSDDDTYDEPRVRNISVRTGVLDEKAAATQAIGMFALHTKKSFAPYPLTVAKYNSPLHVLIFCFFNNIKIRGGVNEDFSKTFDIFS